MEGISRVLHRCHRLTPCLVAGRHFSLLVSLLTGMARYSEMAYVFDLLLQNHHFELLFQRGMDKVRPFGQGSRKARGVRDAQNDARLQTDGFF